MKKTLITAIILVAAFANIAAATDILTITYVAHAQPASPAQSEVPVSLAQPTSPARSEVSVSLAQPASEADIVFTDLKDFPLYGKCVENTYGRYTRLPAEYEGVSREGVWYLGRQSAGLYIRFRSDSPKIVCRWTSTFKCSMPHMTDTGTRGVDLYSWDGSDWRYAGAGKPNQADKTTECVLVQDMEPQMREYTLYLSLYDGVDQVEIGVPKGYKVDQPEEQLQSREKKVVMYGTSIMQGCSASRPGMCYSAIIGRALNREVINLGFSGNGRLDYEIAELMAKVDDPGVFVLDNVPNCSVEEINDRTDRFVDILRAAHPDVPIIMIEDPRFSSKRLDTRMQDEVTTKNEAQANAYERLKARGVKNLYYIWSGDLIGFDEEPFVDGIHYTDLGMTRHTSSLLPVIKAALGIEIEKQDWAGEWRFIQANANVTERPRVVFMGDSITELWANQRPEFFSIHNFIGRGIGGQTTSQMLVRFRDDVVAHHPEYVVILGGTNDIALNNGYMPYEQTVSNIAAMCDIAKANGIQPFICSILPCDVYGWRASITDSADRIVKVNGMLKAYAEQAGIPYIDYHSALKDENNAMREGMSYDHCHPTANGFEVLEAIVMEYFK